MNLFQRIFHHLDELHDYSPTPARKFSPKFDATPTTNPVAIEPEATPMETVMTSINADVSETITTTDRTDRLIQDAIRAAGVYDTTKPTQPINSAIVEATSPSLGTETMDSVSTTQDVETSAAGTNALQMGRILLELDLSPEQSMQLFSATLATKQSIMTLEEVAEMLRLETFEVAQLTRQGQLPGFVAGANLRYRRTDVEAFVASQLHAMRTETTPQNHVA
ncbi:MAG: helix-turn-helix domain-containing protein [Chthonomonas sp.]|nr:helix-turn-helix domain-containing protein [Chthonomonas sp.]